MSSNYSPTDIVIVSAGAVLPDAENPARFFDNVMAGHSSIRDLTKITDNSYRQLSGLVYSARRGMADHTYTTMGAPINRGRMVEIAKAQNMPFEEHFMQHVMAVEAVRQCTENVLPKSALPETDFIFGRSSPSSDSISQNFINVVQRIKTNGGADLVDLLQPEIDRFAPVRDKAKATESIATKMRRRFGFGGLAIQTDAACASSLAALYVAVLRLRSGHARYVVVGGADESLSHAGALIAFSQIGVLTAATPLPFDRRSDGMAIGEGSVAFLLTTLGEAQKAGLPVLAVVKNIGGSSDGKQGGLTEPTIEGQMLCYQRAYSSEAPEMAFIETHGTGTKVGDQTEMNSVAKFFSNTRDLPIGSAKWNVGHTMGAAGATGMLRALGIFERHTLPPSPYFQGFPDTAKTNLVLHKEAKATRTDGPLNVGVSSFGFGGANFHVWMQEYKESAVVPLSSPPAAEEHEVVLCAEAEAGIEDVANLFRSTSYRLPPKIWPFIDKVQLLSVLLAEKTFRDHAINPAFLDADAMHVLADSGIGLELNRELAERVATQYAFQYLAKTHPEKKDHIETIRRKSLSGFSELNDQYILGGLVSLIASRVTKAFNFRGVNFGIEADYACGLVASEVARTILRTSTGAALVFDVVKVVNEPPYKVFKGVGMRCSLLASLPYALKYNLPIRATVGPLEIERNIHAAA